MKFNKKIRKISTHILIIFSQFSTKNNKINLKFLAKKMNKINLKFSTIKSNKLSFFKIKILLLKIKLSIFKFKIHKKIEQIYVKKMIKNKNSILKIKIFNKINN